MERKTFTVKIEPEEDMEYDLHHIELENKIYRLRKESKPILRMGRNWQIDVNFSKHLIKHLRMLSQKAINSRRNRVKIRIAQVAEVEEVKFSMAATKFLEIYQENLNLSNPLENYGTSQKVYKELISRSLQTNRKISKCKEDKCPQWDRIVDRCIRHGGIRAKKLSYCKEEGCSNKAKSGGKCIRHGGVKATCKHEGCSKNAKRGGKCIRHGGIQLKMKCKEEGCSKNAQGVGKCIKHGGTQATCKEEGCSKNAQGGVMGAKADLQTATNQLARELEKVRVDNVKLEVAQKNRVDIEPIPLNIKPKTFKEAVKISIDVVGTDHRLQEKEENIRTKIFISDTGKHLSKCKKRGNVIRDCRSTKGKQQSPIMTRKLCYRWGKIRHLVNQCSGKVNHHLNENRTIGVTNYAPRRAIVYGRLLKYQLVYVQQMLHLCELVATGLARDTRRVEKSRGRRSVLLMLTESVVVLPLGFREQSDGVSTKSLVYFLWPNATSPPPYTPLNRQQRGEPGFDILQIVPAVFMEKVVFGVGSYAPGMSIGFRPLLRASCSPPGTRESTTSRNIKKI
uniref:WRKY19-like zinc finger domain-containing protein n=1 Tax=Timema cristinae TaxID=61476 RepID=A0A7R9HAH4_TIMCR|nr:unnamed protein product [Timema cristinae]